MKIEFILDGKDTLKIISDDAKIFKHPDIKLHISKYIREHDGNFDEKHLIISADIEKIKEIYFNLQDKLNAQGHEVIADKKLSDVIEVEVRLEDQFRKACIKAKDVWEGKILPD